MENDKIEFEIERMMHRKIADKFEEIKIDRQDLTFEYLESKFEEKGVRFKKEALSLIDKSGKYNNAALLLSDQNPTITKIAIFQGTDVDIFLDKKEFTGSILKQLEDVLYFCNLFLNQKRIVISGKPDRDEFLSYPERALREIIVNCYCHRDYTLSGDIKIEAFSNRLQILSPVGLPEGLSYEDIKNGVVAKRNKIIVNVFEKIKVVENYSSGIRRIFKQYEDFEKQPIFDIAENLVLVTLFNRNYQYLNEPQNEPQKEQFLTSKEENDSQKEVDQKMQGLSKEALKIIRKREILNLIKSNKRITVEEMRTKLNVSESTIRRDISELKSLNVIQYIGSAKKGYWDLV